MSHAVATCPPLHALEDVARGHSSDSAAAAHVQTCGSCRDKVEEIARNNMLMAELSAIAEPRRSRTADTQLLSVDGYDIQECIGQGGQGAIFRATQKTTKRSVAIKVLIGGRYASSRQRSRFEREVELAAGLRHPNIVTVFDRGTTADGRHFCVMEYVEGATLGKLLSDNSSAGWLHTPIAQRLRLFAKMCSAVEYAHQRGIIHRDLKPANVLVDSMHEPRIVDFGLAKLTDTLGIRADPTVTQAGEFAGTFAYASPEQTQAKPELIDTRTDVYSLGVILYEMLTGQLPYKTNGPPGALLQAIAESPPRRPSALCADINDEIDTIVLKALAKEPGRRYQSAGELLSDIERYQTGRPIEAKRDSTWYVLTKTVRRHRLTFSIAAFAIVTLAAFAIAMSFAYRRAALTERQEVKRSTELAALLSESNIERGRVMGMSGNTALAEHLLWPEYLATLATGRDMEMSSARWALWELYQHQPCLTTLDVGRGEKAHYAELDPSGNMVAVSIGEPPRIELWDPSSRRLLNTLRFGEGKVYRIAFFPDGKRLAAASDDGAVWVCALNPPIATKIISGTESKVCIVRISRDSSLFATGDIEGTIQLINLQTSKLLHVLRGHKASIRGLSFSKDGAVLASASNDRSIRFWDTKSGACTSVHFENSRWTFADVEFSSDDAYFATIGGGADVSLFKMPGLKLISELPLHAANALKARFSPDDTMLASTGEDKIVRLWDIADGRIINTLAGHLDAITQINFSADGFKLLSLSPRESVVRIWDARRHPCIRTFSGYPGHVLSAAYSQDYSLLATASDDPALCVWNVAAGTPVWRLARASTVHSVAISPQGILAEGEHDGSLGLWSATTGGQIKSLDGHGETVSSVAFSPDGGLLASTGQEGTLRLWDVESGTSLKTLDDAQVPLSKACFSPAGKFVAAGGKANAPSKIFVWNVASGDQVGGWSGHVGPIRSVCYSPDGRMLASCSDDGTIRLWDCGDGRCTAVLEGHKLAVYGVSFRGDGRILASCGGGGEIRLWDVQTGKNLATICRDNANLFGLHYSADGRTLTTWGGDSQVSIWDLLSGDRYVDGNMPFWKHRLGLARN
jgi:WD40 repeat protein/serine/threonine protein kinase